jgi:iron complex outermembrane receptor protein
MGMNADALAGLWSRGTQVLLFILASMALGLQPSVAAIDLGQQRQFDIPPQQLSSALLKFSAQSDIQVTVPGQLVEGKNSAGVVGKFKPGSALAILLKDTSLHYDVVDGSTVVIAGPADRKLSRNDFQKVSNPGTASAEPQEIKLAQATSTPSPQGRPAQNTGFADSSAPSLRDDTGLAEIVVTGSSIKQINGETALPVQILKKDDIDRTGATSVEELFRQISAASSSGATTAAQATGFQTGAISTISLRGLGSARTLILINGRRSAVYGGGSTGAAGSSVDISGIPLAAVERVEILKDGASAIYGSDAIAGVVNFIMRTDYQGFEVNAYDGNPVTGGSGTSGNELSVSGYGGFGDLKTDRFNISGGLNFEHDKTLLGRDRPFATRYSPAYGNDVTSGFAFPANIAVPAHGTQKSSTQNPLTPNCGPSLADVNFPTQCRFDNSPYDSLEPDVKKGSANLSGRYAVTDNSQVYVEASYSKVETQTQVQPVPLSFQNPLLPSNPYVAFLRNLLATQYPNYHNPAVVPGTGAFLLPPTSPYYPSAFIAANPQLGLAGQPLNLIYRDFANGTRLTEDTSDAARFVAGYKGTVGTWDYDTSVLYSEVKVKEDLKSGFALYSKIMPLLDSGTINPFGATTDPSAIANAKAAEFTGQDFTTKTSIASLSGKASGEIFALPAGPLSGAVGAEVRRETFKYDPASAVQTGDVTGQGGNQLPESAARNVESAYVEFSAQILRSLQADAAVRYDNYQRVGSTVNPKFSLRFQPTNWFLARASAGTGFRAPSLTDLYAAQASSVTGNGTRDPILCPTFSSNNPNCSFQFTTITGGNPNLTPEKAKSASFGISLEPIRNLNMDFDSFWIFLRNQIVVGGLGYPFILQNATTATQYASLIKRDPVTNQIISISQTNANLFKANVSGLDSDIRYRFDVTDADRITVLANGTYFYRYVTQNANGSWTEQLDKGLTSVGGVVSRFRGIGTLEYERASLFNISLTGNFQKRYHDSPSNITNVSRYVSAYETLDAQATYLGLPNFRFTLGGKNILNKNPPYANYAASANNFIGGYDVSYGDPRGSFVYGRVVYSFH